MKILSLRFKNLNSLYGEWSVDLTLPEYTANGLFSLTGPTGAGKSTLLDAVCLALYGATPRLGRITKSSNEIMSRQTGECYAEVVFESQAGRYCCRWEQRRARKKPDGKLQDQEHTIALSGCGTILESKKSLVGAIIEEKTGMDFDRFTRSILLAQGGFDTFLKADVEQKSKILEQITGTGVYTEISKAVHERQRLEQEKLTSLQAQTDGIVLLTAEDEQEIQRKLQTGLQEDQQFAAKIKAGTQAMDWLKTMETLRQEIQEIRQSMLNLQSELQAFEPDKTRLQKAEKASYLEASYATLISLRKELKRDQESLKAEESALIKSRSDLKEKASQLAKVEVQTQTAKAEWKQMQPVLQEVSQLDHSIGVQTKTLEESNSQLHKQKQTLADLKTSLNNKDKELKKHQIDAEAISEYLQNHSQDQNLHADSGSIDERLKQYLSFETSIAQKTESGNKILQDLQTSKKSLTELMNKGDHTKETLQKCKASCDRVQQEIQKFLGEKSLREVRIQKDSLLREMALRQKIADLEDYRQRLEDGHACPLCGSKEHPYAKGNVPDVDTVEKQIDELSSLIQKVEKLEEDVQTQTREIETRKSLLQEQNNQIAMAQKEQENLQKNLSLLQEEIQGLRLSQQSLKDALLESLQPYGIEEISPIQIESIRHHLQSKLKLWLQKSEQQNQLKDKLNRIKSEQKGLTENLQFYESQLQQRQKEVQEQTKVFHELSDKRKALFGTKLTEAEHRRINQALETAETFEKSVREQVQKLENELTRCRTRHNSLQKSIDNRVSELGKSESEFLQSLSEQGFADETAFLQARLKAEERNRLQLRERELQRQDTEFKTRLKDRENRLQIEVSKRISSKELSVLQEEAAAQEAKLKEIRDTVSAYRHQLLENQKSRARIQEQQSQILAQKKERDRFVNLNQLIGSADGKKFRNFAQGLTFEIMVAHANRQLTQMTDRYLLLRDNQEPLELNVIDQYQAGETRSTKNLSGGESFIVSLALALGLSKMASQKVRVDSLFLDEGFGTLDEDALETALEALSGLQQEGKLIGVISHVSAINERISTQITISPSFGGRSILSGPGCSRISADRT